MRPTENAVSIDDDLTMTVNEAARLLRIGRNQAYEAVRRGEIPTMRIGGRVLVLSVPLRRILNGDVPQPQQPPSSLAKMG